MTANLVRLADRLRHEFGVDAARLVEFAPDAHNTHVLAGVADKTYHLTLRDLTSTEDTPALIERILEWCSELSGSTGRIMRTQIRSRNGRYLAGIDGLHLSVRLHLGDVCNRNASLRMIVESASEHGRVIDAIASRIQLKRSGLRYQPMSESVNLIESRLTSFVAQHAAEGELGQLLSAVGYLATLMHPPRLVHGDLSFMNLIVVEGAISVIDHDCLHSDHPLYDHAHLLVSLASSEYFHGEFSIDLAEQYLMTWCDVERLHPKELLVACEYVVLKKLALVQQAKNLHISDRVDALKALRTLRGRV